jgi:hypothetical protein
MLTALKKMADINNINLTESTIQQKSVIKFFAVSVKATTIYGRKHKYGDNVYE